MRYLDVCSGISAPTQAWKPLGWQALCFAEIEAAPRAVLAHHYPDTPLVGDFTQIKGDEYGPVDILVGGTPCQSFSVAGLRGGMDDHRGNLALEFLKLAHRSRARWVVFENVAGLLSSNGGRDFGSFLGGLAELGYGWSYAVLDAQWFGVPQRRRRVFVVGYIGDWRRATAALFERHSLSGDTPPRRQAGQDASERLGFSTVGSLSGGYGSKLGTDESCQGSVIPVDFTETSTGDVSHCLNAGGMGRQDYETETLIAHSLRAEGFDASEDGTGRGTPLVPVGVIKGAAIGRQPHNGPQYGDTLSDGTCYTLQTNERHAIAFAQNQRDELRTMDVAGALAAEPGMKQQTYIAASAVRRLTPRECERLQGFPDDFTLVPHRGKPMADGPRYKMLGNSMAVPVVRWIGERIQAVEAISAESMAA